VKERSVADVTKCSQKPRQTGTRLLAVSQSLAEDSSRPISSQCVTELTSIPRSVVFIRPSPDVRASWSDKGSDANEALEGLRWRRVCGAVTPVPELTSVKDSSCGVAQAQPGLAED
jgi:hypothetical protein